MSEMTYGTAQVTLDLMYEIENEEFRRESNMEEGEGMNLEYIRDAIREQIEDAVKNSGDNTSCKISFGERDTEVIVQITDS